MKRKKSKKNIFERLQEKCEVLEKQQEYRDKYKKIIVTYRDNVKKTFTPDMWFIYESKIRPIAKSIKFIENPLRKRIEKLALKYPFSIGEISELQRTGNLKIKDLELILLTSFKCGVSFDEILDEIINADIEKNK